jgi:hypothetical protein
MDLDIVYLFFEMYLFMNIFFAFLISTMLRLY